MPATEEEYVAVGDMGDRLSEALEQGQESLLGFSVMTQGRRDLIFYTADAEAALQRLDELRAGVDSHTIEVNVEWDTFWGAYRSFSQGAQEEEDEE
jgi:hypothetical protein